MVAEHQRDNMKINGDLIRSQSKESVIQTLQYVDLSQLDIYVLEKLALIKRIQILDISHNHIESITSNIEQCPQLWSLNISDNKVRCLDGFSRFVAIGTLDLSGNQLSWTELSKIQHLHILDLRLHGNTQLERDPYYRVHVIDCLPHVWMLDGRLITTAERIQVKSFFDESAVSDRPVRHKLTQKLFLPSNQKNRDVSGVFGEKVVHLMRRFPKQDVANVDLDRRRLKYLSENIAQDISIQSKIRYCRQQRVREMSEIFLVELLEARKTDAQRCNMFIILLLTSIEFTIPDSLIKETLELMRLDKFGNVGAMEVFALPKDKRALVAGVLLSAVKIERVEKQTGGLYDKLYLSMNYLLTECIKSGAGHRSNITGIYKQYRSLLAAEVVLLMCYVPSFAEYLQKEPGVMSLVTSATCDSQVIANVTTLQETLTMQEVEAEDQIKSIGQFVQSAVMIYLAKSSGKASPSKSQPQEEKLLTKKPLPKRPMSGPIFSSSYHAKGQTSPDRRPPRITSAKPKPTKQPDVGETVLIAPQCLARIVSLPQPGIALVLMEMIPVNGAMSSKTKSFEEHYAYIDTRELDWDFGKAYWKPKGTSGNRVTLHYVQDIDPAVASVKEYCHHSIGAGRATPITVPQPYGDTADTVSVVSTTTAQEMLSISPPKHHKGAGHRSASPSHSHSPATVSRVQSSPQSARRTPATAAADVIKEGVDNLMLNDGDDNFNNSATAMSVKITDSQPAKAPTSPEMQRPVKQLSIIQFGAMPPPPKKKSAAPSGDESAPAEEQVPENPETQSEQPTQSADVTSAELSLPGEVPVIPEVTDGRTCSPVNSVTGAYEEVEDQGAVSSDDEELDKLAREDLIRDMLANNDLERSISERNVAPNNSPDMRASYSISRASNQTTANPSRQPSARINSVYRMLKAQDQREGYRSAPLVYKSQNRQGVPGYDDDTYSPYMQERAQEWDMKIHDPDETPNVSVKWANLWMGGGRDLHHEEVKRRPSSAHVPGWKDGLKGARTRSANTMSSAYFDISEDIRYANIGQSRHGSISGSIRASQSTYDRQLDHQQYRFLPQQTTYRSSYLTSNRNMRNRNQLVEMQREMAWADYVNSATLHRQISNYHM